MASLRETLDADWARLAQASGRPQARRRWVHGFSPRFAPVSLIRRAHALDRAGWRRLAKLVQLLNFVVFGIEVPATLEIGPGLIIAHTQGTVLGGASIGSNVTIFHQVTLGARTADFGYTLALRPVVEDDVTLTVGAKVLGPVRLGRGCVVGANAVVLDDVPPGALAVGVPARIVPGKGSDGPLEG
ncbi:MAG TPA: serine acetyltransferase [Burkholderiaceae bacterium]